MMKLKDDFTKAGFDVVSIEFKDGLYDFLVELDKDGFKQMVATLRLDVPPAVEDGFHSLTIDNRKGCGFSVKWKVDFDDELKELLWVAIDVWLYDLLLKHYSQYKDLMKKRDVLDRDFVA